MCYQDATYSRKIFLIDAWPAKGEVSITKKKLKKRYAAAKKQVYDKHSAGTTGNAVTLSFADPLFMVAIKIGMCHHILLASDRGFAPRCLNVRSDHWGFAPNLDSNTGTFKSQNVQI